MKLLQLLDSLCALTTKHREDVTLRLSWCLINSRLLKANRSEPLSVFSAEHATTIATSAGPLTKHVAGTVAMNLLLGSLDIAVLEHVIGHLPWVHVVVCITEQLAHALSHHVLLSGQSAPLSRLIGVQVLVREGVIVSSWLELFAIGDHHCRLVALVSEWGHLADHILLSQA